MDPKLQAINTFQTRVRQMLLRHDKLLKENEELYAMAAKAEKEATELKDQLRQKDNELQTLRLAKMMQISDGDLATAKENVAKMIREVNKCIAMVKAQDTPIPNS